MTAEMNIAQDPASSSSCTIASQRDDGIETNTTCPRCQHTVPSSNRVVHDASCARRVCSTEDEPHNNTTVDEFQLNELSDGEEAHENETVNNASLPVATRPFRIRTESLSATDASHHDTDVARSLANVMMDVDVRDTSIVSLHRQPYSLSYHDVVAENNTTHSMETFAASAPTRFPTAPSHAEHEEEWACPRCTLINPAFSLHCDACLFQRTNVNGSDRSSEPTRRNHLMSDPFDSEIISNGEDEWVNISHRDASTNNRHEQDRLTTGYRIFNSALNGAMIGSVFGGMGGMIFGGIAGGLSGAYVSRVRNQDATNGAREVEEVLRNRTSVVSNGNIRVHRGRNHLIAVSSDGNGGNRILRLRYNGNGQQGGATIVGANAEENAAMEQVLSELLLRMSFMHGLGRGYENVVIQPNLSYEELLQRYGMGNENRGASLEVIDSYPIVVVGHDDKKREIEDEKETAMKSDEITDYGTCGICLEDYQQGDRKKRLSCPHSFHKECIDRWLKEVSSCPICKKDVEMYKPRNEEVEKKPLTTDR